MQKIAVTPIFTGVTAILLSSNCQRRDYNTLREGKQIFFICYFMQNRIPFATLICVDNKKTAVWSFVFTPYSSFTVLSTA